MSRATRFAVRSLVLGFVYLAVVGRASAADIVTAAAAGLLVAGLCPPGPGDGGPGLLRRIPKAPRLCLAEAGEVARGGYQMALVVLGRRPWQILGPVGIPLRPPLSEITDSGVTVLGILLTAAPGTLFLGIDRRAGFLWIHAIDASDPEGIRRDVERFYDRFQRPVAP